jgi:hypothetical protein
MRCSGLAQSRGAVPPISQRPLRRSTTFRGQQPCLCSSCPDHRLALGLPRAGWPGNYPSPMTLSFPKAKRLQVFPAPWLRAFFSPHDPGFPPRPSGSSFPFAEVAQSFLFAAWLGVSPLPVSSKFSLCRWLGGCPPCRVAPGSPLARRPRNCPLPGGPGFPPRRVARSFLRAGGAGLLPARRPGSALCRVARGFPLTGGSGFPLRRLPSRW